MKAFLNCIDKTISFSVNDKAFNIDLTKGDLEDSWGSIQIGLQVYDTNFGWEKDENPTFAVYPVVKGETQINDGISYEVIIDKGSYEDYYGVRFPTGFVNFCETLSLMSSEIDGVKGYDSFRGQVGGMWIYANLYKWAMEFEKEYLSEYLTNWESADNDWESTIVEFLTEKIRTFKK